MDQIRLDQIAKQLNQKNATKPCPRCDKYKFSIIGESEINVKQHHGGLLSYGKPVVTSIPTVIVACDNCGYIAQHATSIIESSDPYTSGLLGGRY